MSRSRVVASRPSRASAASSLSLAAAIFSRLLVPACLGFLACMSAPALVSVSHVFRRSCSARLRGGGSVRCGCVAVPRTGRAGGGHRARRRADARLARGSPRDGRVTSRAHRIRRTANASALGAPSHLRLSTHSSTTSCGQRGSPLGSRIGAAGNTRSSSILYTVDRATPS